MSTSTYQIWFNDAGQVRNHESPVGPAHAALGRLVCEWQHEIAQRRLVCTWKLA